MRKRKERRKKARPHGGDARVGNSKGVQTVGMIEVSKQKHTHRKDAVRKYTISKIPGHQLRYWDRQILERDWNDRVEHGPMPTIRGFAHDHGIKYETWRREFNRGKTGESIPNPNKPGRWIYATYSADKAQDNVNEGHANKGTKMIVTNKLSEEFAKYVKEKKLSPYDATCHLKEDHPNDRIPHVRTWYKHIAHGDIPVHYGQTPYHPDKKRRKGPKPHPAKTVVGRLQLKDRPVEANDRTEPGHLEMDTIVSSINGTGGLLVLLDRCTRRYFIEKVESISQGDIIRALKRLRKRQGFRRVKSVTTDNGCEFLDPTAIKEVLGCDVFYTRAYASYEKGSVENCNRIVRRWHPKGTNFALCTRSDIKKLETTINGIHRLALGGKTAAQYDKEFKESA